MSNIGNEIKQARKYKKMSQEMLAKAVGVRRQTVHRWESGKTYPDANECESLKKFLNLGQPIKYSDSLGEASVLPYNSPVLSESLRVISSLSGQLAMVLELCGSLEKRIQILEEKAKT